jgi:hypothetical protein
MTMGKAVAETALLAPSAISPIRSATKNPGAARMS